MELSARRLPLHLALVGAVHGWAIGLFASERLVEPWWRPDGERKYLLALLLSSALFLAGSLHGKRRAGHRRDLLGAAAKILLCCGALGTIPGVFFGYDTLRIGLVSAFVGVVVGLMTLPSALLLIYAHSELEAPRRSSLFAGADRAEEALAVLGAMVALPWYLSARPHQVALLLGLFALSAMAIGLQAVILARQTSLIAAAFSSAPVAHAGSAMIVCDIGFGGEERELAMKPLNAYRGNALRPTVACRGSFKRASCSARRLLVGSLAISVAAIAQASWLFLS